MIKDVTTQTAELMDEIIAILKDYFVCNFTHEGGIHYMNFSDGDIYAINLIKCNNFTVGDKETVND